MIIVGMPIVDTYITSRPHKITWKNQKHYMTLPLLSSKWKAITIMRDKK